MRSRITIRLNSGQEIAGWARMSDAEREQVLGLLPDRQSRLTAA